MFTVENVGNTERHYYSVITTINMLIYFFLVFFPMHRFYVSSIYICISILNDGNNLACRILYHASL